MNGTTASQSTQPCYGKGEIASDWFKGKLVNTGQSQQKSIPPQTQRCRVDLKCFRMVKYISPVCLLRQHIDDKVYIYMLPKLFLLT